MKKRLQPIFFKTPKEVFDLLARFVVGQEDAKKAVSIAFISRYRRMAVADDELRLAIIPKNILMFGATGVGKTEIIRHLAKVTNSPFIKMEMTKFTEVGYAGRDVETIIKDLTESTFKKYIRDAKSNISKKVATKVAKELLPAVQKVVIADEVSVDDIITGKYNDVKIEINLPQQYFDKINNISSTNIVDFGSFTAQIGLIPIAEILTKQNTTESSNRVIENKSRFAKMTVRDAMSQLTNIRYENELDESVIARSVIEDIEQNGIVFLDEIDKLITHKDSSGRGEVSREGVQRDLLSIVEGTVINTKYGAVDTKYILFVAAGAFHGKAITDLMPELCGRFPVRAELKSLTVEDFKNILTKIENNLLEQHIAMLASSGINISFSEDGIEKIAEVSYQMNLEHENIGARRLQSVVEHILQDISFYGDSYSNVTKGRGDKKGSAMLKKVAKQNTIVIDAQYVSSRVNDGNFNKKVNLNKFVI